MAEHNNICQKVQKALAEFLQTTTLGETNATITAGIGSKAKTLPHIICQCQTAASYEDGSGNWLASAIVQVRQNVDDTAEDDHLTEAGDIFNLLMTDTITDDLSVALEDFTAFVVWPTAQSYDIVDRSWVSQLDLNIRCAGSDIS